MKHRMVRPAVYLALLLLAGACGLLAAEKTSENDPQLKRGLARRPEADANKDGILSETEAKAFLSKLEKQGSQKKGGPLPAPDFANVKYGVHERNVLDFWKAKSEQPTPLVVYIHGGGFVGGSKETIAPDLIENCLKSGISVAAIHYRFVTTAPFPAPQQDGARAIQFLRSKAGEWNLDPKRVAAYGGSAGAGISLWLGFHDDLADPRAEDPVSRQSSRLSCVGSFGGQSTYDPKVIKEWIGGRAHEHPSVFKVYAVDSLAGLDDPKVQKIADECSAIKHLTKDDPPVIMFYNEPLGPLPTDARPGQGIHHPTFGLKLQEAMKGLGLKSEYHHASDFKGNPNQRMIEFFQEQFGGK